jgi:hypothetical protein
LQFHKVEPKKVRLKIESRIQIPQPPNDRARPVCEMGQDPAKLVYLDHGVSFITIRHP